LNLSWKNSNPSAGSYSGLDYHLRRGCKALVGQTRKKVKRNLFTLVETGRKVGKLFPAAPSHQSETAAFAPSPQVEIEELSLRQELLTTPKGLAPGPSGLRVEHLRTVLEDKSPLLKPTCSKH